MHAYTCTHTHIHAYTHAIIHTYIRTYVRTYVHTYIHTYIHTYMAQRGPPAADATPLPAMADRWSFIGASCSSACLSQPRAPRPAPPLCCGKSRGAGFSPSPTDQLTSSGRQAGRVSTQPVWRDRTSLCVRAACATGQAKGTGSGEGVDAVQAVETTAAVPIRPVGDRAGPTATTCHPRAVASRVPHV